MNKKMNEIYFSTLATKLRFWSTFPDRRSYTIGESQANSFNANDPQKQTHQFWIQKEDANPRRGELFWSNNIMPNRNLAQATKKTAARNPAAKRTSALYQCILPVLKVDVLPFAGNLIDGVTVLCR